VGADVYFHAFLTSALDGGDWSSSWPGSFTHRERAPGTHCTGRWVGPGTALNAVVKRKIPSPCRDSNPCSLNWRNPKSCYRTGETHPKQT